MPISSLGDERCFDGQHGPDPPVPQLQHAIPQVLGVPPELMMPPNMQRPMADGGSRSCCQVVGLGVWRRLAGANGALANSLMDQGSQQNLEALATPDLTSPLILHGLVKTIEPWFRLTKGDRKTERVRRRRRRRGFTAKPKVQSHTAQDHTSPAASLEVDWLGRQVPSWQSARSSGRGLLSGRGAQRAIHRIHVSCRHTYKYIYILLHIYI